MLELVWLKNKIKILYHNTWKLFLCRHGFFLFPPLFYFFYKRKFWMKNSINFRTQPTKNGNPQIINYKFLLDLNCIDFVKKLLNYWNWPQKGLRNSRRIRQRTFRFVFFVIFIKLYIFRVRFKLNNWYQLCKGSKLFKRANFNFCFLTISLSLYQSCAKFALLTLKVDRLPNTGVFHDNDIYLY